MTPETVTEITLVTPPDIIDVPRNAVRVAIVSAQRSSEIQHALTAAWGSEPLTIFHGGDFTHPDSHSWLLNRVASSDYIVLDLDDLDENLLIVVGAFFRQSNSWLVATPQEPNGFLSFVKSWAYRSARDRIESCVNALVKAHDSAKYLR